MDLEDKIAAVPEDAHDMFEQINQILHVHVSEVYSPPRVTLLAAEHGLSPGAAFDITVHEGSGVPYGFNLPEHRAACREYIIKNTRHLVIGSPMCTSFSTSEQQWGHFCCSVALKILSPRQRKKKTMPGNSRSIQAKIVPGYL